MYKTLTFDLNKVNEESTNWNSYSSIYKQFASTCIKINSRQTKSQMQKRKKEDSHSNEVLIDTIYHG